MALTAYRWSPATRRASIPSRGLVIGATLVEYSGSVRGGPEIRALHDTPPDKLTWIGVREIGADAA